MFRQAINTVFERYIDNKSAMKEWEMASHGFLPLTQTIMRDFNKPVELAYHVTDIEGLITLKGLIGQKKTISVFKRGGEGISTGARRQARFLVSVSGVSSFDAGTDFNSQLSRSGYKWLNPIMTEKDYVINNEFTVPMNKKMMEYFGVEDRFSIGSASKKLDGTGKAQFMKWYMDESKKIITKELIEKIRASISKKTSKVWSSDEFLLHEVKVREVKIVKISGQDDDSMDYTPFVNEIEKLGFKFSGYVTSTEIEKIDIN